MSDNRTYKGYGKALEGAHLILDPEERAAVRHTYFLAFGLGCASALLHPALGVGFMVLIGLYHLLQTERQSRNGEI